MRGGKGGWEQEEEERLQREEERVLNTQTSFTVLKILILETHYVGTCTLCSITSYLYYSIVPPPPLLYFYIYSIIMLKGIITLVIAGTRSCSSPFSTIITPQNCKWCSLQIKSVIKWVWLQDLHVCCRS